MLEENKIKYNEEDLQDHDGIAAIVMNEKKEVLMLFHNKFNFWTIPVGKVKHTETVEEGLKTELGEEINIVPTAYEELGVFPKIFERRGKKVNVIQHLFIIKEFTGEIKNNEPHKHETLKWMSLEEVRNLPLELSSHANLNMLSVLK